MARQLVRHVLSTMLHFGLVAGALGAGADELLVTVGDPVVVAQGPVEERRWGRWQFPELERLADGRLYVQWHVAEDAASAYGSPKASAVSSDEGKTWKQLDTGAGERLAGGTLLPNGERLRLLSEKPLPLSGVELPEPAGKISYNYGNSTHTVYRSSDLPEDVARGWPQTRLDADGTSWVREYPAVDIPGQLLTARDGVLARLFFMGNLVPAPDKSLWTSCYWTRLGGDGNVTSFIPTFVRSTDLGHSWKFMSDIPYQGDKKADPKWNRRGGFTEPELAFMPDKSVLAIMRTTDGEGTGPLYTARSTDQGKSWSKPRVFDNLGVLPQLLVLKDGFTLASYGRPGLFVRATADKSGQSWAPRVEIPLHNAVPTPQGKTCAYTKLLALDGNSAMLVYSDFNYPDKKGAPRKTILVRKITVTRK